MDSKTLLFKRWLDSLNGIDPNTCKLEISDKVSVGDRGLIAKENISSDECVLTLILSDPRLILTPNRAIRLLHWCDCVVSVKHPMKSCTTLDPLDALTLFFYHIKSAESDSMESCLLLKLWKPYLDVLPKDFSDISFISISAPALFETILSSCPSSIRSAFLNQSLRTQASFSRIFSATESAVPLEFSWAWSLVNSRCVYCTLKQDIEYDMSCLYNLLNLPEIPSKFKLTPYKNQSIAIVPFFDFFNHSPSVISRIDTTEGFLKLTTQEAYSVGDQVFINYGPHDNLFLLCEYGFSIPNGMNPYDVVYPTYGELIETFSENIDSLNDVLEVLQLYYPDMKTGALDETWKSVYLASNEPSYYLILILYVVTLPTNSRSAFTRDRLFAFDESKCLRTIRPSLKKLLHFLLTRTEKAIEDILSTISEDCAFTKSLIYFLNSRRSILSSLLDKTAPFKLRMNYD